MSAQHRRIGIWVSGLVLGALPPAALATTLSSSLVPKFVDPLPRVCGANKTPNCAVMTPTSTANNLDHYEIAARPFTQQILPAKDIYGNAFNKTSVFGYGPNIAGTPVCGESGVDPGNCFHFPAASVAAQKDRPVEVNWLNQLVDSAGNFVTYPAGARVQQNIHWANPPGICDDGRHQTDCVGRGGTYTGPIPMIPHLHGALHVTSASDGIPEAWYLPASVNAAAFVASGSDYCHETAGARDCTPTPGAAQFRYPNNQPPTTLFFHDHTLGVTMQNIAMGLVGAYVISGVPPDDVAPGVVPSGDYDIPLLIQDKRFDTNANVLAAEEGNIEVVNGKSWPYLSVEPRKYLFRIVNGGFNSYLHLHFSTAAVNFTQVAGDQSYLPNPQSRSTLLIAPGERVGVIVDFQGVKGRTFTLQTDSVQVLQVRVGQNANGDTGPVPAALPFQAIPALANAPTVSVALFDSLLGAGDQHTAVPMRWDEPTTEFPATGSIQEWDIYNAASQDSHPIHLHEVAFQVIDRRNLDGSCVQPCGPRPGETGLKDTVIADRGQITRVRADFRGAMPGLFAWHCHITPHEDDEMMRPMCIVADPAHQSANPLLDGFAGCPAQ